MKPSALPASSTGQWRACWGSRGRVPSRPGLSATPRRLQVWNTPTSIRLCYSKASVRRPSQCDETRSSRPQTAHEGRDLQVAYLRASMALMTHRPSVRHFEREQLSRIPSAADGDDDVLLAVVHVRHRASALGCGHVDGAGV